MTSKDYRLFSYAMKAYGLSDMTYAKAFLHKVLTEGISGSTTFVDARYREFAAAFDFASLGEYATQTEAATSGTVGKYLRQTLEEDAGQENEGVRLALQTILSSPDFLFRIEADPKPKAGPAAAYPEAGPSGCWSRIGPI